MISVPGLLEPANGAYTGSPWQPMSLQPLFSWTNVGAAEYEIQLGASCVGVPLLNCEIGGIGVVDTRVTTSSFQPESPLVVSTETPVGRRYYWRVRACLGSECGAWSQTRYLNVGRIRQDFDGDGYGDIVVSTKDPAAIQVFYGNPDASVGRTASLSLDRGLSPEDVVVTWAGDVDADGFADLAVARPGFHDQNLGAIPGEVWIYRGGVQIPASPTLGFQGATGFGSSMSTGDVNADGFADIAICGDGHPILAQLGPGFQGTTPIVPVPGTAFVGSFDPNDTCGAVADFDGDGLADLVVTGAYSASSTGTAAAYFGRLSIDEGWMPESWIVGQYGRESTPIHLSSPESHTVVATGYNAHKVGDPANNQVAILDVARQRLSQDNLTFAPEGEPTQMPSSLSFGTSAMGSWRIANEPNDTLIVGFPTADRVVLYDLSSGTPVLVKEYAGQFPNSVFPSTGNAIGFPGDYNGDGYNDMVLGNAYNGVDSPGPGEVYLYLGGASLPDALSLKLLPTSALGFGASVD
jgi:hypothetical protein